MTDPASDDRQLSDEELVVRARGSCASSARHLEQLLGRHRAPVFRRCMAIIGHPDDAEDITQEVMLRVLRGLDGYQGRSSFRTWLHAIVRNECWTFAETRERRTMSEEIRIKMAMYLERDSHIRADSVPRKHLHEMFGRMPREAREIVQLRYLREMPLPNIALLLGMSLSATKMRLYRALSLGQQFMDGVMGRSRGIQTLNGERLGERMGPTH